ncbi:MAG: hypothetical protein PUB66_08385 [Oscillospiraceae bacterium]|nr:hypothetical protein [Oscillospiraceae bacterium]
MSKMFRVIALETVRQRIAAVSQFRKLQVIIVNITQLIRSQTIFKCSYTSEQDCG